MTEALRLKAARSGSSRIMPAVLQAPKKHAGTVVAPRDLSSIKGEELTPKERERCIRDGARLLCRETGTLAGDCPKGREH